MKQATRIARRQAREEYMKNYELERNERIAKYKAQQRKDFVIGSVKVSFFLSLIIIPMLIINHYENIDAQEREKVISKKLDMWNQYKAKNCKEVEKIFAMQMGSGKFSYVDNGIVYQCNNGIKYTLSDRAATGKGGLSSIPDVPKM